MLKKRGLILITLSLLMAVAAAGVANNWVQGRIGSVAESGDNDSAVLAAAIDIPYGTKLEARHVKTLRLPGSAIPSGAIHDLEQVKGWIATSAVLPGELLMEGRFVEHSDGSTLAALVETKKRAITVRVDDVVGVAGFLLPGNFVDVLATRIETKTRRAITETVLRNIKVLAVDQTAKTDDSKPVVVRAVTLEMLPKQAEVIVKRKEEGTIQLTLRNPLEKMAAEEKPKPQPKKQVRRAPRSSGSSNVTVIRGTKVQSTKAKT